jgi:hypothetical protein
MDEVADILLHIDNQIRGELPDGYGDLFSKIDGNYDVRDLYYKILNGAFNSLSEQNKPYTQENFESDLARLSLLLHPYYVDGQRMSDKQQKEITGAARILSKNIKCAFRSKLGIPIFDDQSPSSVEQTLNNDSQLTLPYATDEAGTEGAWGKKISKLQKIPKMPKAAKDALIAEIVLDFDLKELPKKVHEALRNLVDKHAAEGIRTFDDGELVMLDLQVAVAYDRFVAALQDASLSSKPQESEHTKRYMANLAANTIENNITQQIGHYVAEATLKSGGPSR